MCICLGRSEEDSRNLELEAVVRSLAVGTGI